jgi:hypothetical protein
MDTQTRQAGPGIVEGGPEDPHPETTPRRKPLSKWVREVAGIPEIPEDVPLDVPVSRFIPLTRQAVMVDLCEDMEGPDDTDYFAHLAIELERHRAHAYRLRASEIRRLFLPFSPDADTLKVEDLEPDEAQRMERELAHLVRHLLDRANYQPIPNEELSQILSAQSPYSLRIEVDLEEYDLLHVFARDIYVAERAVRRPETLYLLKARLRTRVYRRLFVALKLKTDEVRAREVAAREEISEKKALKMVRKRRKALPQDTQASCIYVKVFKDMPEYDLQILFPLRSVHFRPFDRIKFFATAAGGTAFGVFSTTGKVLAATNPIAMVGALIGFIGLLARQITQFFNQRNRYMMELSQKLFFHNLANNRAALTLLLDRAEEEDVKEELITLYFLRGETVERRELAEKKRMIEDVIAERYGVRVDFEIEDALRRLVEDRTVREEGDTLVFPTLRDAAAHYARLRQEDDEEDTRRLMAALGHHDAADVRQAREAMEA